jgi:hypothetical protein
MISSDRASGGPRRLDASRLGAVLLFLLALVVYNVNLRRIGAYDSLPASLIPMSLLSGDGFALDRYAKLFPPDTAYTIRRSPAGRMVPLYPPVTPLLALPIYAPFAAVLRLEDVDVAERAAPILEKFSASLFASGSVAVLFLAVSRRATPRIALVLALAYAFGTSIWSIGSQALWQHGASALLFATCLWLLALERPGPVGLAGLGLIAALLTANRPVNAVFSLAIAVIVLRRWRRRAVPFLLSAAGAAAIWIAFNRAHYSSWIGGYGDWRGANGEPLWMASNGFPGFFGLLVSNRGLFVYSPFLLLFFRAPRAAWKRFDGLGILLLAFLAFLYLSARTPDWAGGFCYGPRFATDALPLLVLALVAPLESLRRPAGKILFALAVALSIVFQAIGAFCFPGGESGNEYAGLWTKKNFSPALALRAGLETPDFAYLFLRPWCQLDRLPDSGVRASYRWVDPPPRVWRARQMVRVTAEIRNEGDRRWTSLGGWRGIGAVRAAGYWAGRPDGPDYISAVTLRWLGIRVASGGRIRRDIWATAPNVTGQFRYCFDLFQIGTGLFQDRHVPPLCQDVTIAEDRGPTRKPYAVEWSGGFGPREVVSGRTAIFRVGVRDVGTEPWSKRTAVSYHVWQFDGTHRIDVGRVIPLSEMRPRGEMTWIDVPVEAKLPPGLYEVQFDLADPKRGWATTRGSPGLEVKMQILPAPAGAR